MELKEKLTIENIKNLYATYKCINKSKEIMKDFKPDVIIGTGGYICVPTVIAAQKELKEFQLFYMKAMLFLELQ